MSQNSTIIANGTGGAVRTAINNALGSIVSLNSGASAPSATTAFMLWADTSTSTLKLRNAANTAWYIIAPLAADMFGYTTIASAATTNIGTTAASVIHISGITTITSFGAGIAGQQKILIFDGALTLTHNATSLILPAGTNISITAGKVATFICEGSSNWRCVDFNDFATLTHSATSKTTPVDADELALVDSADTFSLKKLTWANLKATLNTYFSTIYATLSSPALTGIPTAPTAADGTNTTQLATTAFVAKSGLIQTQYAELTTSGTTTAFIPADDTIPQITEGVEILTVSITPKFATSRLLISVVSNLMEDTNVTNLPMVAALFRDSTADAFWASVQDFASSGSLSGSSFVGNIVIPASSTSATTFRLRMGVGNTATATTRWNGYSAARKLGGAQKITLMVQEIV